jgi:hypothetical protein
VLPVTRTSDLFTDSPLTPREAYLAEIETVAADAAVGRISAEQVTIADAADPELETIRVVKGTPSAARGG